MKASEERVERELAQDDNFHRSVATRPQHDAHVVEFYMLWQHARREYVERLGSWT